MGVFSRVKAKLACEAEERELACFDSKTNPIRQGSRSTRKSELTNHNYVNNKTKHLI